MLWGVHDQAHCRAVHRALYEEGDYACIRSALPYNYPHGRSAEAAASIIEFLPMVLQKTALRALKQAEWSRVCSAVTH